MTTLADPRPYRLPAALLGIGLGGLLDEVVLHQALRWHHVNSPAVDASLLDGALHLAPLVAAVVGVLLFRRAAQREPVPAGRYLVGAALLGWGAWYVVEGLVMHHLLGIHHLRGGPDELAWDLAFLAWGAAMAVGGWWLMRRAPAVVSSGGGAPASR